MKRGAVRSVLFNITSIKRACEPCCKVMQNSLQCLLSKVYSEGRHKCIKKNKVWNNSDQLLLEMRRKIARSIQRAENKKIRLLRTAPLQGILGWMKETH